jgi:hypothetical protein
MLVGLALSGEFFATSHSVAVEGGLVGAPVTGNGKRTALDRGIAPKGAWCGSGS